MAETAENTEVTNQEASTDLQLEERTPETIEEEVAEVPEENSESEDPKEELEEEEEITLGEDSPPQPRKTPAPKFVKDLRRITRKQEERIRELESLLGQTTSPTAQTVELKKPTLESCEYDEERFEQELDSYHDRKRQIESEKSRKAEEEKRVAEEWAAKLTDLEAKKSQLKVNDYDECEFICQQSLTPTQQGIIVEGADNAAHVFYILGKYPDELKKLSGIQNPVKFAYEVARLESRKKVNSIKRSAPAPERAFVGTSTPKNYNSQLEQLRDEAMRTGNWSKVLELKKTLRK